MLKMLKCLCVEFDHNTQIKTKPDLIDTMLLATAIPQRGHLETVVKAFGAVGRQLLQASRTQSLSPTLKFQIDTAHDGYRSWSQCSDHPVRLLNETALSLPAS